MKILETMTITEAAEVIRSKAIEIKNEKNISEQQAYSIIFENIDRYLGDDEYVNSKGRTC